MHKKVGLTLLAFAVLTLQPGLADTIFNVRAFLDDRTYVTGTVSINTGTGLVTGAAVSVLDQSGGTVATLGTVSGQGIFAPFGIAPAYNVDITDAGTTLFNLDASATSLVNYAGGPLCAVSAAIDCAFSDFYQGGAFQANVLQGFLAPASDAITVFDLTANFDNGDHILGTVTIDTTQGLVLDEYASLYSGSTVLKRFNFPSSAAPYLPGNGSDPAYLIRSRSDSYLFNLGLATTSLVNYTGGNVCGTSSDTNCDYSDFFDGTGPNPVSDVTAGRLFIPSAVPEPSSLSLIAGGLIGLVLVRRRRSSLRAMIARPVRG